jgi:glycerol-3-phosphate acyltransferase PlsY
MWRMQTFLAPRHRRVAALMLASYVYGSLPMVHMLARRHGVNLQRVGSGNVGATGLWCAAGAGPATLGWLADLSKGAIPVIMARKMGLSRDAPVLAGTAGLAGQCWPIFLRFHGGRGISTFVGVSLALDPRRAWRSLLPAALGSAWRLLLQTRAQGRSLIQVLRTDRSSAVPLGCLLGVLAFPLLPASGAGGPPLRSPAALLPPLLIVARRLSAPLPDDSSSGPAIKGSAYLYRLLFDRNTRW